MKKVFMAALLAVGFSSMAQEKGNIEFGANIGLNMYTATTANFQADSGTGFNVGVGMDYYFSDRWSIKGKLVYDQKGWDNGFYEDINGVARADYSLNYLTIPVMANYHFASKRNWYLNFGPYIGFLMSAEESSQNTDVKEGFNATDFGLAYGIGVKIPVSTSAKLFIEYEGQGGLSDIFKENGGNSVTNARSAFNVGVNFLLK